jgi:GT2 family glycosyltransferase
MPKPVALILLNWNTPVHTANCVSSLLENCETSDFDIIIADNGSTDKSLVQLKTQFPDLIFLDNKENLGFAEGNNRALEYSISNGYTYSMVMNNDTEAGPDLVKNLLLHLQQYPKAAAVQPAIYWLHQKEKLWNGEGRYYRLLGKPYSYNKLTNDPEHFKNAKWLTGCCMLIRNSMLQQTGLFNKQFFLYFEDVELSFRIRAAGHELHYLPGTKMYHEAGASAQTKMPEKEGTLSPVIHYYIARNHIWFLRKHGNPLFYPIMLLFNGPYYITLLFYFLLRGRYKKAKFLFNGLKDGFFVSEKVIWQS